jgi:hypothetical protein
MKLTAVVQELKKERDRAQSEVEGLDADLRSGNSGRFGRTVPQATRSLLGCNARKNGGGSASEME